ncbi:MAG: hypothetical protein WDN45_15315 [Caulobacteraceae bacterium]
MRTIIERIALGAGLAVLGAGAAMAQAAANPAADVQAANGGKRPIVAVYASKPGLSDWSDDMLGKGTLKPGQSIKLKFKAKPDSCKADFNALLDNGDSVTRKDVDLCGAAPAVQF